jgi:MoxR-like ATPase
LTTPSDWRVWTPTQGSVDPDVRAVWLDEPPPWRKTWGDLTADQAGPSDAAWRARPDRIDRDPPALTPAEQRRATTYVVTGGDAQINHVNLALRLRRPLLVTGPPGIGKSSLAIHLGHALGLGATLRWEISSRTTLQDGLYSYDAVSHLAAVREGRKEPMGTFIRLGPLGTALLPTRLPRVLLIDELDKASYDLPNDLLHVFEEGRFVVPELARLAEPQEVSPDDHDPEHKDTARLHRGQVRCHHHPVVVITSNREREFPEAFRRRCVQLTLRQPEPGVLAQIAAQWFPDRPNLAVDIPTFLGDDKTGYADQSPDVLLQALLVERGWSAPREAVRGGLRREGDEG